MTQASNIMRQILVIAATAGVIAFNWLAVTGHVNGVTTEQISDSYPTLLTPAGYAFTIWSLIYFGMVVFSLYQLLPKNAERFRSLRSLYIFSCAANCAWIFFWHQEQIGLCLLVIFGLLIALMMINWKIRNTETFADFWFVKTPFGIYFGWVTVATIVNFAVALKFWGIEMSETNGSIIAGIFIILAAGLGVLVRVKMENYFYPLAIAWAVTAIAVKQSGHAIIVVSAAIACIVSLFVAISFVLTAKSPKISRIDG
jgi:benzodiazapine receptor